MSVWELAQASVWELAQASVWGLAQASVWGLAQVSGSAQDVAEARGWERGPWEQACWFRRCHHHKLPARPRTDRPSPPWPIAWWRCVGFRGRRWLADGHLPRRFRPRRVCVLACWPACVPQASNAKSVILFGNCNRLQATAHRSGWTANGCFVVLFRMSMWIIEPHFSMRPAGSLSRLQPPCRVVRFSCHQRTGTLIDVQRRRSSAWRSKRAARSRMRNGA